MNSQFSSTGRRIPLWFPPVVFLVAGVVSSIAYELLGRLAGDSGAGARPWWLQVVSIMWMWAVLLAGTWWANRHYDRVFEPGFFSVRLFQAPRSDGVYLFAGVLLQIVVGVLYYPFHSRSVSQPVHEILGDARGWQVAVVMLSAGIGAPIVEEIFFRGLLLRSLQTVRWRVASARLAGFLPILLSGLLFAGAHFQGVQFFGLAFVGVVLAIIRVREGRIAPSIMTHAGFNLIALAVAYGTSVGR